MIKRKIGFKIVAMICSLTLTFTLLWGCGAKGKQIDFARINDDGELVLYYTDGTEENLGLVNGEDGADGLMGERGDVGSTGPAGKDGTDGVITVENNDNGIALAASKGLQSAVSITCEFTVRTGYYMSTATSAGSGVIYTLDKAKGDALIITNYHVVYNSSSTASNKISNDISVFLYGSEYDSQGIAAEYVGGSMNYDIAVLSISDSSALKSADVAAVTVANSEDVYVGDTAIAIGNPEGMGISASSGVVNVDSEYITMTAPDETTQVTFRVMRVDAAVNSGNSGGGLYNSSGELIGIVNAKVSTTDVENIGYAIPSNLAVAVADNIIDNFTLKEISLGFTPSITDSHAEYDVSTGYISIVEEIQVSAVSGSGLFRSYVQAGDIIVSVSTNEKSVEVTRKHHLTEFMLELRLGDTVTLKFLRDGIEETATVTVS